MTLPETMCGVVLTGHGGPEMLEYRTDIPVPRPGPKEVLVRVAAAAVNNTDINTRTGWYSRGDRQADDASLSGKPLSFPRIQGADVILDRDADYADELGASSVDVVIDLVAGPAWPSLPQVLRPGGRYAVAGAIAGPIVELDVRTLYLKDLSFFGCTVLDPGVFGNLVRRIERGEVRPLVAETWPLEQIGAAQAAFQEKGHTGKIVLFVDQGGPGPEQDGRAAR